MLLPRFNPKKDSAGFQYIPRVYDIPQVQVVPNIDMSDFVQYRRPPRILTTVEPKYPDSALVALLEGSVFVRILVGTSGRAESVSLLKSDAEVFNGPAIEAAKRFVFIPAYLNNMPIRAWTIREIHFRLPGK